MSPGGTCRLSTVRPWLTLGNVVSPVAFDGVEKVTFKTG